MFTFAIIGTGAMGLEHIRNVALLKSRGCCVVCAADSNANARAEARAELDGAGFEAAVVYEDWRTMLQETDVDAVIICTPNFDHINVLRVVVPMSRHHILCEKPMCTKVADCLEVESLLKARPKAAQDSLCFMVGMEYRWMPPIARLIEEVDSQSLGTTRAISIREHRFPFLHKVDHWNRFNSFTGGTLVEKACHFFDLMRRITGNDDPVSVYASGQGGINHRGETYAEGTPDILDFALVIVQFSNGARAHLDLNMFAEDEQTEWVCVVGDKGKVEAKAPDSTVRILHRSSIAPGRKPPAPEERAQPQIINIPVPADLKQAGYHEGATYFELSAFVQASTDKPLAPPVSVRDGTLAVAMGQAAHVSLEEKRVVLISEVLPAQGSAPFQTQ